MKNRSNFASSAGFCEEYYRILSDNDFPEFLREYIECPSLQRLKGSAVSCGANWTDLHEFRFWYSTLDHSIGVALVCWRFTGDKKCALAGLLHDIATPAFKHCIDFMNKDHENQESTEDRTSEMIMGDKKLMGLLLRDGIRVEEVADCKIYPIADNDTPKLSADRLEYLFVWGCMREPVWNLDDVREMYNDLVVAKNEDGIDEIVFRSERLAEKFTKGACDVSSTFLWPRTRMQMEFMADVVKKAIEIGVLELDDLWRVSERQVVDRIRRSRVFRRAWRQFENMTECETSDEKIAAGYCKKIPAKKRYVNPLVVTSGGNVRINEISDVANESIQGVLGHRFDEWIGLDVEMGWMEQSMGREVLRFYFSGVE